MKQKLADALGSLGLILYFILSAMIFVLPIVMIGKSFWLNLLFFFVMQVFPASSVIFWVWGLFCAIGGPQDIFAIIFYIAFAVMFLPFFINTVAGFFRK